MRLQLVAAGDKDTRNAIPTSITAHPAIGCCRDTVASFCLDQARLWSRGGSVNLKLCTEDPIHCLFSSKMTVGRIKGGKVTVARCVQPICAC